MTKVVSVFGGSGFIGSYVVKILASSGYMIKVICRNPENAMHLKVCGKVGQVVPVFGNINNSEDIKRHVCDVDAVINLVGILHDLDGNGFMKIHAKAAEDIAKFATQSGVKKLIHFSALGVDGNASSLYARSKLAGEEAVRSAFPDAVIVRSGLVFGEEDKFFNMFVRLISALPCLPLVNKGKTLFQPIYVSDVAQFVVNAVDDDNVRGKLYEIGGDEIYSLEEMLRYIMNLTNSRCMFFSIPNFMAFCFAYICEFRLIRLACRLWTGSNEPILTVDQVKLLMHNSIVEEGVLTLRDLGIEPKSLNDVVPEYIKHYDDR